LADAVCGSQHRAAADQNAGTVEELVLEVGADEQQRAGGRLEVRGNSVDDVRSPAGRPRRHAVGKGLAAGGQGEDDCHRGQRLSRMDHETKSSWNAKPDSRPAGCRGSHPTQPASDTPVTPDHEYAFLPENPRWTQPPKLNFQRIFAASVAQRGVATQRLRD